MSAKLGVGIIGTGAIAREHARSIAQLRGLAHVTAATDVNADRLDEFCRAFRVAQQFGNADRLISDRTVDLVVVTTPPAAHEELVMKALERGKYVLCEKPLAHSLAAAQRIAAAASRYPGRLSVSYQMRYDPVMRRLIWLSRSGAIGIPQSVEIERHSYIPESSKAAGWWGDWSIAGGGVLLTQLVHEIDILLAIMGRPDRVRALMDTRYTRIDSEDYVDAIFHFSANRTARCVASVGSGRLSGGFNIRGERGSVALPWSLTLDDPARLSQLAADLNAAVPDPQPPSSLAAKIRRYVPNVLGLPSEPELTPHARLYADIVRCSEKGAPLPIPATEAIQSLEMCTAAYQSALTGKDVSFPLTSISAAYNGVSKEDYDARQCARM